MIRWHERALSALDKDDRIAMIQIVDVSGSAPRDTGTRMFVSRDGQWGTIGGGNLEFSAVDAAKKYLADRAPGTFVVHDYALGPELEQCCGGYVRVLTTVLSHHDRPWLDAIKSLQTRRESIVIETSVTDDDRLDVSVSSGAPEKETFETTIGPPGQVRPGQKVIEAVPAQLTTVFLFGAGHVGQAVAAALAPLPLYLQWYEGRSDYIPASHTSNLEVHRASDPAADVADAPPNSSFLIFTHSHELDYQTVKAVLARGDFRYCGLIGSRTKRASFERRLRDEGISEAQIGRLTCPIGLPLLKSKDPTVIAIGVAAQIMSLAEARQGGDHGR